MGLLGCGGDGSDDMSSGAPGREPVAAHDETVDLATYPGVIEKAVRVGEVVVASDDGFPTNIRRFDLVDGAVGRVVNPPIDLFLVSLVASGDRVLVVGNRCDGVSRPGPDDEPSCPGPMVALVYDPATDEWAVVTDPLPGRTPGSRIGAYPGPDDTAIVFIWGLERRSELVTVDLDGNVEPFDTPDLTGFGPDGSPDAEARLCPIDGGVVAYSGSNSDIVTPGSAASTYTWESRRWSRPASLTDAGLSPSDGFGSSSTCTDDGIALLGHRVGQSDAPSASFDGEGWSLSEAPASIADRVDAGSAGVFFDGVLWHHDDEGAWRPREVSAPHLVVAVPLDDDRMATIGVVEDSVYTLRFMRVAG